MPIKLIGKILMVNRAKPAYWTWKYFLILFLKAESERISMIKVDKNSHSLGNLKLNLNLKLKHSPIVLDLRLWCTNRKPPWRVGTTDNCISIDSGKLEIILCICEYDFMILFYLPKCRDGDLLTVSYMWSLHGL